MSDLVDAGGLVGLPEAIAEFLALTDCDPAEVKDVPQDRLDACHGASRPVGRHNTRRKAGTRHKAPQERNSEITQTAEDRLISQFERKTVPWGKYAGKRWKEVPVDFAWWFANLANPKAPGAKALQVQVREYLEVKYGMIAGRLF